ncbi:MAG: AAA family ATPase [Candidatus Moraniibacteriota bacterium]
MSKLIFIVGLPGSGKTKYVEEINSDNEFEVLDDFKGNAILNKSDFTFSSRYCDLINYLKSNKNCIVTDIDFCKIISREEAEIVINGWELGVEIEWVFFENNPEQCTNNVKERAIRSGKNEDDALLNIKKYTSEYNIPIGIKTLDVWKSEKKND